MAVLALGAGCGGGGGGESDATASTTKAQFVKEAEAVCESHKQQRLDQIDAYTEKSGTELGNEPPAAELKRVEYELATFYVPSSTKQLEEMEKLEVPEGDEEEIEAMLDNYARGIEEMKNQGVEGYSKGKGLVAFQSEAQKYGLVCEP